MNVFVTGSTGYLGTRLVSQLVSRGHTVRALVRSGSEKKVTAGCDLIVGDALRAESYRDQVPKASVFVHLVGVSHPSPAKASLFRSIDLVAAKASLEAAVYSKAAHFVYLSVAQPAPVMKAYVESRREAEEQIRAAGIDATFLRPWYVLGPGHRWAYALLPMYWIFERLPRTRDTALRLGLVTLRQMLSSLVEAVETPAAGVRIVDVPQIRRS